MNKQAFKTFLSYHWVAFLGIFIFVSIFYYYVFDILKTPTYDESVRVFIASENVDVATLEEKLFQGFEDSKIKEVKVDYSNPTSPYFSTVFQTRGLVQTDILILPDGMVPNGEYDRYFVPLQASILQNYLPLSGLVYYVDDDTLQYGIQCSPNAGEYFATNQNSYYVFFNKNSNKIGLLGDQSENDAALTVVTNLFSEEQV